MLTEGWDANTVTHVLGIRAFGTQLLCEQVIGRALRRQSYDLNEEGLFNVEYADVFGIPFDFTAKPVIAPPQPPRETVQVKAMRPERDALEIRFPRVEGYRVELPRERLSASSTTTPSWTLTPRSGRPVDHPQRRHHRRRRRHDLEHLGDMRPSTLLFNLTQHLLYTKWRDPARSRSCTLFGQLKRITKQWLDTCLKCKGGTYPAQLMYQELADMACNDHRRHHPPVPGNAPDQGAARPYNPTGSTAHVRFNTSKTDRWETSSDRCHVNWVVSTATGKPSSAASPKRTQGARLRQEPQPRASKCRTATAPRCASTCPTSSCWSMTAMARTTCCTWSSRSRATGAKTPRRRNPPWTPTGCPA
jgi:type III restriction enzyme